MDDNHMIGVRSPEFREFLDRVEVATRLSSELSALRFDETEPIREAFERLIGRSVGERRGRPGRRLRIP